MKKIVLIIGVMVGTLIVGSAFAQASAVGAASRMQQLDFMKGRWSGSGWMMTQDRKRVEFTQKEEISFDLNGTVLRISGKGWNSAGESIHNAFAVVYFNLDTGEYGMHSFLEDGKQTLANVRLIEPGKLEWWFKPSENATIKYTLDITEDTWTEKGAYSPDGQNWFPFIEFTLKKES